MKKVVVLLCVLWMGSIFYFSSNTGQVSNARSLAIARKIIAGYNNMIHKRDAQPPLKGSSSPHSETKTEQIVNHFVRKDAHFFLFLVLAILLSFAFYMARYKEKDYIIYSLFICLLYSVLDEFHQSFVKGRTSRVADILIDFSGSALGILLFYIASYLYNEKWRKTKFGVKS